MLNLNVYLLGSLWQNRLGSLNTEAFSVVKKIQPAERGSFVRLKQFFFSMNLNLLNVLSNVYFIEV